MSGWWAGDNKPECHEVMGLKCPPPARIDPALLYQGGPLPNRADDLLLPALLAIAAIMALVAVVFWTARHWQKVHRSIRRIMVAPYFAGRAVARYYRQSVREFDD